jgi:hypothetical protein
LPGQFLKNRANDSNMLSILKQKTPALSHLGFLFVAEGGLLASPAEAFPQEPKPWRRRASLAILWAVLNKEKALHPPSASGGSFYFWSSLEQALLSQK